MAVNDSLIVVEEGDMQEASVVRRELKRAMFGASLLVVSCMLRVSSATCRIALGSGYSCVVIQLLSIITF